ncbi:probable Na(+)/H(+) antiporter nhx-9 isoform X2 [Watersipora subatra]|uniref:probable Na(+)/H(+) antiporter nhx-9 isoform X2 n=1 Tax=Watersipora subatra TaxID=2589382 RepID=UPI00355B591B
MKLWLTATLLCLAALVSVASTESVLRISKRSSLPDSEAQTNETNGSKAHHERYQVFHFNFKGVESAYVVSLWIFIASIAKIGFHLNNKLSSIFPESCLLIILGIIVGIMVYLALGYNGDPKTDQSSSQYSLHAETFFQFLLPPIILDAGYFMPNRAFFNNIGTILLYAVVGTCWNTASIGLTLWGATQIGLTQGPIGLLPCLVFSSLISAVDPVAVLAVFEEIHVNEQLHIVVFGESLLNDAVTVVLYQMFIEYSKQDEIQAIDIFAGILQFLIVGIGGVLIGILFGMLCALITKYTSHVRVIEPIFVFLLAYLGYLTAEMFHLSGIMALTFCGITMKQYVVFNISEKSQTTIKYFLKMLSSMTETVIFMMLGTSAVKDNHVWDYGFIVITIAACLLYRAIGTVVLTFFANTQRVSKLKLVDQFVMAYGGLRGAIAFALAILISEEYFPNKDLFVTATILVVMFTVFVQGITIKPLVNALKVKKKQKGATSMSEQIHGRLLDHMMAAIEDITGYHGNHTLRDKWEYYDDKYLKKVLLREKPVTKEHSIMRTHSKLSLKDAMHTMHSGFSSNNLQTSNGQSLLRLISNWSVSSFQDHMSSHAGSDGELQHNDTVVDMQALDAHFSKKIADDTKTHHMLEENLIVPRSKVGMKQHQRHTIQEEEADASHHSAYFHHNAKLHLRHMISKHQHHLQERKKQRAQAKMDKNKGIPKNVSFANIMTEPEVQANYQCDNGEDSDEGGIEFTVRSGSNGDVGDGKEHIAPVALECQLPWKRSASSQDAGPVTSLATHQLPNDNKPELAQLPSWADNLDYNHIPVVSPRPASEIQTHNGRLNASNNNSNSSINCSGLSGAMETANPVPTITIDGPKSSANNLVVVADPSTSLNGGAVPPSTNQTAFSLASDSQESDSTGSSGYQPPSSESEDDAEVEIKPFGKVPMSSRSSAARLARKSTPPITTVNEHNSELNGNAVKFTLSDGDDSDDGSSMSTNT